MTKRRISVEPNAPKYQQLMEILSRDILTGRYGPGQKIPSEACLVQQFGASRITVGRALRELRARGLVERVAGSGTYVRRDRSGAGAMLFGLLIPDLGETEIFEPICRGMAGSPQSTGHALLWGHTDQGTGSRSEQALQLCRQFIERGVSGVFFAPLEFGADARETNAEIAERLDKARIPVVLLDRDIVPYPRRSRCDLVGIDNRRAAWLATAHLLDLATKRIAFLAHHGSAPTVDARIAGYREALAASGRPELVMRLDEIDAKPVQGEIERERPDAFVCVNDRAAAQLLQALSALGLRVPEDVRMVGVDDVEFASLLPVPLTTIHQPCREIGAAAMSAMLERIARPDLLAREILLETRLVVRRSCGARP